MQDFSFSSDIPFSLFSKDSKQYSLRNLNEESKTFFWHQFMLDVLLDLPRSATIGEDVITGTRLLNENDVHDPIELKDEHINSFQATYTPDMAIHWYTRDSFLYRALNKACRTLNSGALVPFHSFVKDLNAQLKQLHAQQRRDGKLLLPLTVYRGQTSWGQGELQKIRTNIGGLISINTFLSTTTDIDVASLYASGAVRKTSVRFEIRINKTEKDKQWQTPFARIREHSEFEDEDEVLFGMSSVFKVISVREENSFSIIKLELVNIEEDKDVQRLKNEVKSYLYQISGKQLPFIVFKQLLARTSHSHARPLGELIKFFLADVVHLFVINAYVKEGRMKEFIDKEPALVKLVANSSTDIIRPNETSICLLFDMFNNLLYSKDTNLQERIVFNNKDSAALLCFGGFLLLIGDSNKGIQYFQMLLKYDSINEKSKAFIHGILGVSYATMEEKKRASESFDVALQLLQPFMTQLLPPWLAAFMVSSQTILHGSDQQTNKTLPILERWMNEEQFDDDVNEKMRLIHLGHICFEQDKFLDALNHWEEAVEIVSYVSSLDTIFNGVIYAQMGAAYSRLNNMGEALNAMKETLKCMKTYYPSTHRMFASFNLTYGLYLIQNKKPTEAIECLEKALNNPHFSTNQNFLGIIYFLLVLASIQCGNLNRAEEYCNKAREYSLPPMLQIGISAVLEAIPELKISVQHLGQDVTDQFVDLILLLIQQGLSNIFANANALPELIDEQTGTYSQFIAFADHYRHRHDYIHAETYYKKALEKMTEIDSKHVWNVYRKMRRMNSDDNDQYREDFIEQYSNYDYDNPKHFQMIVTLQIIMYKFSLAQNEFELAFNCLIQGTLMTVESLYDQINVDSKHISDLFDRFVHQNEIPTGASILTKLIQMHANNWAMYIQNFLSIYFASNDLYMNLAKVLHHEKIDRMFDQIKDKSNNDQAWKSIFPFLHTLLQLLRQSVISSERSTLSFRKQALEFVTKYNDETEPLFYLMKTLESLLIGNRESFRFNLNQFRLNTLTFKWYEELKEKISDFFRRLEEDQLYKWLETMAKTL